MPRVTITVPDQIPQPYRFQLDRQVVKIGRGSENDIVVDCGSVSSKHAEMVRIEGGYELRDLGSTNGIKLDDQRREVIPLRDGAAVKLGDVAFDFRLSEEERDVLRREKVLEDLPVTVEKPDQAAADKSGAGPRSEPQRPMVVSSADEGGGGFMKFLLILLFLLVAFFAGLSIRHYKATGGWLYEAIQSKTKTLKANRDADEVPATEAPSAPAPEALAPGNSVAPAPAVPDPPAPAPGQ
ncbi:MAG: FHA domain-containing protein [Verrucomicrobia bacterium]|nr:FHA domain-containing protein [Verrucomicrobiota bacterium]